MQEGVPADASVLIIGGPTSDYLKPEVGCDQDVSAQRRQGAVSARSAGWRSRGPVPTLEALLKEWGITMGHDVVIDISGMGQLLGTDASVPVVASYPPHPVTENFSVLTAFPLSQSVKGEAGVELGMANTQNLIQTSERSWSESDVKSLSSGGKVSLDESAGDHKGPITIALSLSMDAPEAPASAAAAAPAPRRRTSPAEAGDRPSRRCASSSSATPISHRMRRPAFKAIPTCSSI